MKTRGLDDTPEARGKFRWEWRSLVTRGPEAGGSVRQFSGALPLACLPLPLLPGISGHEATSSQRKLGGSKCTGFSWLVSQTQFPLLPHMRNPPFRPADVSPPSHLQPDADVPSCNAKRNSQRTRETPSSIFGGRSFGRESERGHIPVEKNIIAVHF